MIGATSNDKTLNGTIISGVLSKTGQVLFCRVLSCPDNRERAEHNGSRGAWPKNRGNGCCPELRLGHVCAAGQACCIPRAGLPDGVLYPVSVILAILRLSWYNLFRITAGGT